MPGIQREHDKSIGIELECGGLDPSAGALAWNVDLRDWFPFYHPDPQGPRQHAFDRNGLDQRDKLEIPFYLRQIQCEQVLVRPQASPTTELVDGNHAVGLHIEVLNGEGFV